MSFGGGFFGSGEKKTTTTYNTVTNTEQTDNSGNSGFLGNGDVSLSSNESNTTSISDSGNTYNTLSDSGAIKAASDIAGGAFGLAGAGLDNARAAAAGSINFAGTAIGQLADANANSLDVLKGLVSGAFDSSKTLARDVIAANKEATATAISGFGSLAQQNSQSSDDRVQKVALYALVAVAAVFILPAIFKGHA
jgi:hypothetical protein